MLIITVWLFGAMSRSLVVSLVLATLPLAAASGGSFAEDWSSLTSGWTPAPGFLPKCEEGGSCVMSVDPVCCEFQASTSHPLDIALDERFALDFAFRALQYGGDSDTNIVLTLDGVHDVVLHPTEGANEGVSLLSGGVEDRHFARRGAPLSWGTGRILLDASLGLVQATFDNASSKALPLPSGVSRITSIRIDGAQWQPNDVGVFHYGTLTLVPSDACLAPAVALSATEERGSLTVQYRIALPVECGAEVSWWLDFGDGTHLAGRGPPPATVSHTYPRTGHYLAGMSVLDETTGGENWDEVYVAPRLTSTQVVSHGVTVASSAAAVNDPGLIVLETIAGPGDVATLEHTSVGRLAVSFYDAGGRNLSRCATLAQAAPRVECDVPDGAAFARVDGEAALGEWTFTYEYVLDQ